MQGFFKAALLALVLVASHADAQIYKCIDVEGRTTYQDTQCPQGSESDELNASLSSMSGSAIRSAAQAAEMRELRDRQEELSREIQSYQRQRPSVSSSSSSYQERLEERNARVSARARGVVPTGSNVRDAERMMGRPDSRRAYSVGGQSCEHLIWRDRDGSWSGSARACDDEIIYFSNEQ